MAERIPTADQARVLNYVALSDPSPYGADCEDDEWFLEDCADAGWLKSVRVEYYLLTEAGRAALERAKAAGVL